MIIYVDELLTWLHNQIDPHDSRNPKYAELWRQIEAIRKAQADIMAVQTPKLFVRGSMNAPFNQLAGGNITTKGRQWVS